MRLRLPAPFWSSWRRLRLSRTEARLLCIHDNTALAEAEVEYEDHTSPSIWVTFKVVGGGKASAKIGGMFPP